MRKVYVLVHEWQFDDGESGLETFVYERLENAQEKMKELSVESEISWDEFFDTNYVVERGDLSIVFFEAGEYNYNHENLIISEQIVK